jgi:branched-chain amino acid transport system ATP-binding protein
MLAVENLHLAYGKVRAVQGVSIYLARGELVTLIGANGAGKSSVLHAVCGLAPAASGTIRFDGEDVTGTPYHRLVRRGVVLVPEGRQLVAGLTVAETLMLGASTTVASRVASRRRMDEVLEVFPMLRDRLEDRAGMLSGGQAQVLALARGLMAAPRLLLLDEPSLGLAPMAVRDLFGLIARLHGDGLTMLVVEQNVHQALAIADRGYVIESGRVIVEGRSEDLKHNETLVASYLGVPREAGDTSREDRS